MSSRVLKTACPLSAGADFPSPAGKTRAPSRTVRLSSCVIAVLCLFCATAFGQSITPPPPPDIPPLISNTYPEDADHNAVSDVLEDKVIDAETRLQQTVAPEAIAGIQSELQQMTDIQLVFIAPVSQKQIDDFLAAGGEITYMYQSVSYGWNGRLPLAKVGSLPSLMGPSLVFVEEFKPAKLHLDMATRTGRVRPAWVAGFAGSASGFDGDPTITIAVVDTGVDGSHTDLTGRQQYWKDFTGDGNLTPVDLGGHGSHVSGIATGTGASAGSATGTVFTTDNGDLTGVPVGSFFPAPLDLPTVSHTYTSTATWLGGGTTTLYQIYHAKGIAGGWTALSSSGVVASPTTLNLVLTGSAANAYCPGLVAAANVTKYVVASTIPNYPAVGDGFNKLRGVAPACKWAGAKVFNNTGSGVMSWTDAALDDLVTNRSANNIKVINMSLGAVGNPGLSTSTRQKTNTAVNNGIVVCCSAGNDGGGASQASRQVDDPGRAAMALTVAAANDVNALTSYSSEGFAAPGSTAGQEEDYKPDLMAPGGSAGYYTSILSVDSNGNDGTSFADQRANDYTSMQGTSMASPFTAGCAALIIDAMQQQGTTWSFASSQHSSFVKMILCATSTETNAIRETNAQNPTLERAAAGPNGYPASKDIYEGYGMINPDAGVEAVSQIYVQGATGTAALGPAVTDRRAWARKVNLYAGWAFNPSMTVPVGGDFDLYLYSAAPSAYGTPVLLASSTNAGNGVAESINYTPPSSTAAVLVVKRVSGSGTFSLVSTADTTPPTVTIGSPVPAATNTGPVTYSVTYADAASGVGTITLAQANITLTPTGTASGTVGVSGAGNPRTVTISSITGDGTLRISVAAGTATDNMGNSAPAAGPSATFTVDNTAPTVTSVTSSLPNGSYTTGQVVPVAVTFSEAVNYLPGTGVAQIQLETGVTDRQAPYASGSGTSVLTFNYTVQAGDTSPDLEYLNTAALTLTGTASIKDGTGNNATLTLPALASPNSLAGSKAIVIDTTAPTATSVTSGLADGTYTTGQVVPVAITFSKPVNYLPGTGVAQIQLETGVTDRQAPYASGSGTSVLTFNYTVQAGDASPDLEYLNTAALTLTGTASIKDGIGNNAILTLPALATPNSLGGSKAIVIDTTAPTVSSVTSSLPNGSYTTGQVVPVAITFSEPVNYASGTGVAQVQLETGVTDRQAPYASGSGTSVLIFNYTVQAGDSSPDLEYLNIAALTLTGTASIQDAAGNSATLTLPALATPNSLGGSKAIVIDTTAPTVSSVTSSLPNGTYATGQVVPVAVTFSEAVTYVAGTGVAEVQLETGTIDRQAPYSSGSGSLVLIFNYTVQAGDSSPDLEYLNTAALTLTGTASIKDAAGNSATLTLPALASVNSLGGSKAIVIDAIAPTVSSVTSSLPNGSYTTGQAVPVAVTFSEAVTYAAGTGVAQVQLETGITDRQAPYASGSGTSVLIFNYTVQAGDASPDLDYLNTAALTLTGTATIQDAAGNSATLTLPALASPNSLAGSKAIVIDTIAPTVSSVTSSLPNGSYTTGQVVPVAITFDEAVTYAAGTGVALLQLETGAIDRQAPYASGSGSSVLFFNYTVQAGDASADLEYLNTAALTLTGTAVIQDVAGNNAALALPALGSPGSLGGSKAIVIDTTPPTGTITINSGATFTVDPAVTLTLSSSDGSGSGVTQMQFSNDGSTWSGWESVGTSKSWNLSPGYGSKTVYVQYKDLAGNVSVGTISDGISYDAGVIAITITPDTWGIGSQSLGYVGVSGAFSLANTGNVAEDVNVLGGDAAGGWALQGTPGPDAFSLELDRNRDGSYETVLTTLDQLFASALAASDSTTLGLRYRAPTSDTYGAGVAQDFTITFKASLNVP